MTQSNGQFAGLNKLKDVSHSGQNWTWWGFINCDTSSLISHIEVITYNIKNKLESTLFSYLIFV